MAASADSHKSIIYALVANFTIAIAKTTGAILTGSASMLAEAIHSFADCGNQGLLLWGMKEADRAPTPDHPLGFGKAIYFWSFIVALMLFSMGGLFSVYEGVHKFASTVPVQHPWVAVAILSFGIVAESVSLWGCVREINKVRGTHSLWSWFKSSSPERAGGDPRRGYGSTRRAGAGAGFHRARRADRQSRLGRSRIDCHRHSAVGGGGAGRHAGEGLADWPKC